MCVGVAEGEVVLRVSEQTMFSPTGRCFFFFFFVHVAQLSIALGRHTLPHVRVRKGANDGRLKEL